MDKHDQWIESPFAELSLLRGLSPRRPTVTQGSGASESAPADVDIPAVFERETFDLGIVLEDRLTGVPLARQPYRITTSSRSYRGVTDDEGRVQPVPTGRAPDNIEIEILGIDEVINHG